MNKFLMKIAEETNEQSDGIFDRLKALGSYKWKIAIPTTIGGYISNDWLRNESDNYSTGDIQALKKWKRDENLKFTISKKKAFSSKSPLINTLSRSKDPFFVNANSKLGINENFINIGSSKNPGVIAHEMGHAKSFQNSGKIYNSIQGISRRYGKVGGGVIGLGMLMDDRTKDNAWIAPIVGSAPILLEEGRANSYAYNALSKYNSKLTGNRFLKNIAFANTLSYGLPVVGSSLALYLASKKINNKEAPRLEDDDN